LNAGDDRQQSPKGLMLEMSGLFMHKAE
jgi:hypothetical protein